MRKILILAGVAGFLVSCSGGTKTGDKSLVAITVAPPNPSIEVGGTLAFTATAHLVDGEAKDVTADPDTQWESSAPGVVSVDDMGTATAVLAGKSLITATRGGVHSPAQQVTVAGTPVPTATPTPAPTANHVVISEVSYDTAFAEPANEYIEIHNPTASAVNISGWKITNHGDVPANTFTIPAATSLLANGYYTVANNKTATETTYAPAVINTGGLFQLVNSGDWLELRDSGNVLVDQMAYGTGFSGAKPPSWCATGSPSATAKPVSRKPVDSDGDTCDDWIGSAAPSPGSPTP